VAKINDDDINALREKANIVDVVSGYTALKKSGPHTFKGLCPFHSEKTPSFQIDVSKGLFHCFGCGEGGNLYQFVQKVESLPFPEAVEWLAKREGFLLRYEETRPGERAGSNVRARIIAANEAAAAFFHETLLDSPDAVEARNYLGGRGFGREVAERWKLGYAPGRDSLYKHLTSKGFTQEELMKGDLVRKSERDGGMYDTFRQRIIFPTWNLQGDVVGFGARAMGDQQPKYLNSSETPVFSKSRLMYGLDRAKSAISRGVAVVVEGYTDVIALHEAGISEAVATNGVALGGSHFEMLKKFTQRVVLMLDSDSAGRGATERSFEMQHRVGVDILVAILPAGGDPADVVKEDGPDGVRKAIDEAQPLLQFKLEEVLTKVPLDTPEARARAVREAARVLGSHPDPIARSEYVFMAAERIGVDVAGVERALSEVQIGGVADTNVAGTKTHEDRRLPGQVKVEREALRLLLESPQETRPWVEGMADDEFTSRPRREVFTAVRDTLLADEPVSQAVLVERLSPDAVSLLTELSVTEMGADEAGQERIDEVFTRLRVFRLERHIKIRRETLQQVNPIVDADRHDALFTELVGMEAERRDLLRRLQGTA
jgi:DNA primase